MFIHTRVSLALATLILTIAAAHTGIASAATPEENLIAAASSGPAGKLGPWLANAYDEYQNSSNKSSFRSRNALIKVRGGMVGVDLYASDAAGLQRDLAQLGARNVKAKGPLVSAQVPVAALSRLAALPSLKYAMPALATARVASQETWSARATSASAPTPSARRPGWTVPA